MSRREQLGLTLAGLLSVILDAICSWVPLFLGGVGFHALAVKGESACTGVEELFQKV
jgi:hypothetical protein